jgi:hypothetical protein
VAGRLKCSSAEIYEAYNLGHYQKIRRRQFTISDLIKTPVISCDYHTQRNALANNKRNKRTLNPSILFRALFLHVG